MRRRLQAAGVAAAAIVVGAAVTVGYGLHTGFDRAADSADLPDVIARFDPQAHGDVDARVEALPNVAARSYRFEVTGVRLRSRGHFTRRGVVHLLMGGRRGYDIVAGRDARGRGVVIEQGLADAWNLRPGDRLVVGRAGPLKIDGIARSPDNVAFPLARTARLYLAAAAVSEGELEPNMALLWLRDRAQEDVTLAQARTVAFGLGELRFITREGVRVTVEQAAGIVIALLVAFALVALVAAATMLTATAHADVRRRLPEIGMRRALGFNTRAVVAGRAKRAVTAAAPAAAVGIGAGAAVVAGPAADLLAALNEQPPGWALLGPLALAWAATVALATAAAALPAWRAARRPIAPLLRGGELAARHPARAGRGGLVTTGARFALAARARWIGSVATIAACAGIVLLMLSLASVLVRLRDDPALLGKRYDLTVDAREFLVPSVEAIDGVAAAGQRYSLEVADAFRIGQPLRLIGYRGDHTRFEAPPLAAGRRARGRDEAEVGEGLADALGLRPGSTLAAISASGTELRFRVSGIVRALEHSGRVAWVDAQAMLAAEPDLRGQIAIRLRSPADRERVERALGRLDLVPSRAAGATTRDTRFLGILAAVLRAVALAIGLVCLYALAQGLAMTARDRRGALAMLRALGAERRELTTVLAGASAAVVLPAAAGAVVLEIAVFAPVVSRLAADYATLPLRAGAGQVALVVLGLVALAALAATVVTRRIARESIVAGLREELA